MFISDCKIFVHIWLYWTSLFIKICFPSEWFLLNDFSFEKLYDFSFRLSSKKLILCSFFCSNTPLSLTMLYRPFLLKILVFRGIHPNASCWVVFGLFYRLFYFSKEQFCYFINIYENEDCSSISLFSNKFTFTCLLGLWNVKFLSVNEDKLFMSSDASIVGVDSLLSSYVGSSLLSFLRY